MENYAKIPLEHIGERGIQAAYGDRVEGATLRGFRRPKLGGARVLKKTDSSGSRLVRRV